MSRRVTPTIALVGFLLLASAAEPMLAAATEEVRQGSEAQVGVPWRGSSGIMESVAQIMARDRRAARTRPQKVVEEPPPLRPAPERVPSPASPDPDPAGSRNATAAVPPTPGVSFLAVTLGEALAIPPDTMGSVGPGQILVHTNGRVKLFDKFGAPAPSGSPFDVSDDAFWTSVRDGFPVSDPHVEYDRLSGRWFLTIINIPVVMGNRTGPNRILIAASSGSTITSTSSFTFFQFEVDDPPPADDTNRFADYPTLGVDAHAVYIGANMFLQDLSDFANTSAFVINKADLLADTLTVTAFRSLIDTVTLDGPYTPQAVHNQDPGATEGYFIGVDFAVFGELDLLRVTDPSGTPAMVQMDVPVPVTAFPMFGVPQPSPGPLLDDIDDRFFGAMIARDPGGQLRLWAAHNIEVDASGAATPAGGGGRDGSRWYEIGNLTGIPTVVQVGTFFDPAASQPFSHWMPSIAANGQGHAVIGASRAGANATTGFAGAAVAQRLATDPPGTLGPSSLIQPSPSLYDVGTPFPRRWGDYSQTVIDPNDNMTFWTFQEYTNATNSWGVRVIELKAPPPAIPSSASPRNLSSSASIPIDITGTSIDGSGFFDPGPDSGGPGFLNHLEASVDGGIVVNDVTFTDADGISLDLDTTGDTGGIKTLTVTNPDGQSVEACGLFGVGNDGDTTAPTAPVPVSPADGAAAPSLPTLSWQAAVDVDCNGAKYQLYLDGVLNRDNIDGGATTTTPVAPLSPGTYAWRIRALDDAGNFADSASRTFTVKAPPEPKHVSLKAKPKKVEKGKKVKLTATVSPCAGHEGDQVELLRGSKKIATKTTNDACLARFRVKMRKKARFQAVSPQQDDDHLEGRSKKVKVRVV